jgi:hypothetical protein
MSKSSLTIHKEILKKEYAESPIGKMEREITKFYDELVLKGEKLPEDIAKQVYDLRDLHEKKQMDYIDESQKRDRDAVDAMLMEAFTKELEILNNFNKKI